MAKRTIEYLKSKFETGDKPTQDDFWDWLDTFLSIDDAEELYAHKEALESYLSIADADSNYLKKADAATSYITKKEAADTYLRQTSRRIVETAVSAVTVTINNNWGNVHVLEPDGETATSFTDITSKCQLVYTAENKVVVSKIDGSNLKKNTCIFG